MEPRETVREESLDPQDWEAMRLLGHQMVDDMMGYLENVRERPVWQPVPPEVKTFFQQPAPRSPQDPVGIYQEFVDNVLPYPMGNIHPRFWGWVMGNGTPLGMLAEMLAAGMNPNCVGGDHAASYVESQVLDWMKQVFGFPQESGGLLVSGGSMANLVGLASARNRMAGFDLRQDGLLAGKPMVLYTSAEAHSSIQKAVELLGLGNQALRKIPVDSDFRIDLNLLQQQIQADHEAGLHPFCVVGNAGTVNTGAVDDLEALAEICEREGLWFHVDGAFGGLLVLSDQQRPLVKGIERANSIGFDLHKWMYMPFEIGCALVRSGREQRETFSLTPAYLQHQPRGAGGGDQWFSDYGVQLSRGFRALKAWMSIKEHGLEKYGRLIEQNVEQAQYLTGLIEASPALELLAPSATNIVCFRFNPGGLSDEQLDHLNEEILFRLHEQGIAVPTYTRLNGCYALRVAITNHRSRREDFDLLANEVVRLGREIRL